MAVGQIGHGNINSVASYGNERLEGEVVKEADMFYRTARGVKLDFRSITKYAIETLKSRVFHGEHDKIGHEILTSDCAGLPQERYRSHILGSLLIGTERCCGR